MSITIPISIPVKERGEKANFSPEQGKAFKLAIIATIINEQRPGGSMVADDEIIMRGWGCPQLTL